MQFEIAPIELLATVKRLFPHVGKVAKFTLTCTLVAEGDGIDVVGQFDNQWRVPAKVLIPGACTIGLQSFATLLKSYPPKKPMVFSLHGDRLHFGTSRAPARSTGADTSQKSAQHEDKGMQLGKERVMELATKLAAVTPPQKIVVTPSGAAISDAGFRLARLYDNATDAQRAALDAVAKAFEQG